MSTLHAAARYLLSGFAIDAFFVLVFLAHLLAGS